MNTQLKPHQIYLVLDAMTGQDAVNSAKAFNEQLELDGLILTKFDSDTRGGALLGAKMVTGKPVKFLGVGEKLDRAGRVSPGGHGPAHPGDGRHRRPGARRRWRSSTRRRRPSSRRRWRRATFTLDDFMAQMAQVKKLGPMGKVMGMIPGMGELTKQMGDERGGRREADGADAGDLRFDDDARSGRSRT